MSLFLNGVSGFVSKLWICLHWLCPKIVYSLRLKTYYFAYVKDANFPVVIEFADMQIFQYGWMEYNRYMESNIRYRYRSLIWPGYRCVWGHVQLITICCFKSHFRRFTPQTHSYRYHQGELFCKHTTWDKNTECLNPDVCSITWPYSQTLLPVNLTVWLFTVSPGPAAQSHEITYSTMISTERSQTSCNYVRVRKTGSHFHDWKKKMLYNSFISLLSESNQSEQKQSENQSGVQSREHTQH